MAKVTINNAFVANRRPVAENLLPLPTVTGFLFLII